MTLIKDDAGSFRVTERGRALRQAAEDATDRYFYASWAGLNDAELDELRILLMGLRDRLRQPSS